MERRTITAMLALGLTAALISPPAQAVSEAAHVGVAARAVADAPMVLAAAKKASKGRLNVKVTGSGTYTVLGKGVRKAGRTSKVFRVMAGRYTVKAPGASVKPGKVRVRAGKTTKVSVRFASAGAPPAVTPVPVTPPRPNPSTPPGSTGEQWVEAGAPATVTAPGGYSISIPAGVLQQRSLVTVTPQPPAEGTIPTVDVHIDGPWSGQVQVGVPLPAGATGTWPILVHDAVDGTRISSGQAVSLSTVDGVPVVTASVSSLSQFQSWDQIVCQSMTAEDRAASYLCANNRDRTFQQWFRDQAAVSGARLGKDGGAREHPCHYSGGTAESVGTIPFGVSCSVTMEGQQGRFAFTNNFHGKVLGWSSGAVYGLSSRGGEVSRTTDLPADIPWVLRPIVDAASGATLVPAATVRYDKPLNSAETSLVVNANLAATGVYQGMQLLAGQVGDQALAAGASDAALVTKFGSCASKDLNDTVADCFTDAVKQLLGSDAVGRKIGATPAYMLKKVLRWADVGSYTESLVFAAAAWQPNPEVLLSNVQAVDPPTDRGGNDYIARDPGTGRAVRYYNGQAYDIANGGTFNCLATTRVVWDNPRLRALRQDPVGTATCDNTGRTPWTYTPTAAGGNTGTDIILRDTSTTPHRNYLINSAGDIQTIPDGGTYLCLAASNPVIWNTPTDKITPWRPVGVTAATCGGAALRQGTVTAGSNHTCALGSSGKAWCWGSDGEGQLGDGDANQEAKGTPVAVAGDHVYTTITAGWSHTCGLDTAGKAWCWGYAGNGQLGDGETDQRNRYAPVAVDGDRTYTTITAGGSHTCALETSGKAWCWGYDNTGQVGDGGTSQASKFAPVAVEGDRSYTTIAAGSHHTCALETSGKAWCWGYDYYGQIGNDAIQADVHAPAGVAGGRTYKAISAGSHTCALDAAGKAWCWGNDSTGQVGDGGTSQASKFTPVAVVGDRVYATITAGWSHTCALEPSGKAWCWGEDTSGQVGDDDTNQQDKVAPVTVSGDIAYTIITAGGFHTCALDTGGRAWCWGYDNSGQVGDGGANQNKYRPVSVTVGPAYRQSQESAIVG
jgi:alpha-tubulin suppressor-like RCC1 family protein